jgi:hypothetical protein
MSNDFILPMKMRSVDTAGIALGSYTEIGNPFLKALSFLRITNASDTNVIISYDGINDHEFVYKSGGSIEINFQKCASVSNSFGKLRKGTILYIRGAVGTGLVYVSGYYNN